jgi:two-component system chemotaxis response regulator CheB
VNEDTRATADVVTSDLIMPNLDGVGFVREQMARDPVPIVIVSVASGAGEMVLDALDAGAVDFIQKPTALASDRLLELADDLVLKVRTAAEARLPAAPDRRRAGGVILTRPRGQFDMRCARHLDRRDRRRCGSWSCNSRRAAAPLLVAAAHAGGYTDLLPGKLDELSPLHVVEASDGIEVRSGTVLIAPAGRHLTLRKSDSGTVVTHLDIRPLDTPHRPSVDVLFQSAADIYGGRGLGVVMTGMGADGREGAAWIKAKGGVILTEAEESCVVYGMPRSIVEAGLSDRSVALERMAEAIVEHL